MLQCKWTDLSIDSQVKLLKLAQFHHDELLEQRNDKQLSVRYKDVEYILGCSELGIQFTDPAQLEAFLESFNVVVERYIFSRSTISVGDSKLFQEKHCQLISAVVSVVRNCMLSINSINHNSGNTSVRNSSSNNNHIYDSEVLSHLTQTYPNLQKLQQSISTLIILDCQHADLKR
jgi:hypothetical protein